MLEPLEAFNLSLPQLIEHLMCKTKTRNCTLTYSILHLLRIEGRNKLIRVIIHIANLEMACVALTSLISTIELEFLQPTQRVKVLLHDRSTIISFHRNLYWLQAFLPKKSGGALRDLEIQIRDFALEVEDDIEIQLSNILLVEDTEYHREMASQELLLILRGAAENAAELLKIIAREKKSCVSETDMAIVALTILITKFKYYFLQPYPYLGDEALIVSLFTKLSSLQAFFHNGGAATEYLESKIRNFALKAEDDIEIQLNNFLLAKDTEHEKEASQELRQTLQEVADSAAEIIIKERHHETDRKMTCNALTSLRETIERSLSDKAGIVSIFLEKLSCLQVFLLEESGGGEDLKTKIIDFAEQLCNFFQAKETKSQQKDSTELRYQAWDFMELRYQAWGSTEEATALLGIISTEKEYHKSARKMASDALKTFMKTFHYDFLHPFPIVHLDDKAAIKSFFKELSYLQEYLLQEESSGGVKINDLETKIRDFVFKAEGDIEEQIKIVIQAKDDIEYQEKASQLNQTVQEAAEKAEEMLMIINSEKECDDEIEMACVALNSLMGTIEKEFLDEEAVRRSFHAKISSLLAFLQKEPSGGNTVKDLETKIKDFALKAEDDIKIQLKFFGQAKNHREFLLFFQKLHQTVREAEESAAELLKIINHRSNETQQSNSWLKNASKLANVESHGSSERFLKLEGRMIGRHHDFRLIKDQLLSSHSELPKLSSLQYYLCPYRLAINDLDINNVIQANDDIKYQEAAENVESNGSSQRFLKLEDRIVGHHFRSEPEIISIVGMVGIGKTTLARKVYEDPSVALRFKVRGWITIPQDYNKRQMLCDLLRLITPQDPNVIKKGSTIHELEMQVYKCLSNARYLIVLDNISNKQALIDIRECVPINVEGSCILLTTRHFKREYYPSDYIHRMTLLDPKESWDLLCDILSLKEHMVPKFEKIRNPVVEKCDGLPQLIVEVAKRLSECNNIQQGWKKIEKELESLGILDRNALTASYNPLPHHLKVCFLYFGVFPKRKEILVKMLIRLWIAEGFVKPWEHKELEDQAYGYLQELIDRSLLLTEDQSSDGQIKTCRMHSALHSFCVGEAQKEGILCAVNTQQHSGLSLDAFANSCRWLSFYSHSFDYYVLFSTNIPRSIFFFHETPGMLVPLKLLRVLTFDTSIFLQRMPLHLGDLVFLRYLSIPQWFEDLDYVVSNSPNLQTLVVSRNGAPTVHLPSSIWKPPHLRHLELGNSYTVDPPSMVKENLLSLSCVMRPIYCRKEVYEKFPNIKKLKIFLKDDTETSHTSGSCTKPIVLDHFIHFKELEKLSISVSIGCNVALPDYSVYPSRLKKLKLSGINISERDLTAIDKLGHLTVLKLENAFHEPVRNSVAERRFPNLSFSMLKNSSSG